MTKRELTKVLREAGIKEIIISFSKMDDIAFVTTNNGRYEIDMTTKRFVKVA